MVRSGFSFRVLSLLSGILIPFSLSAAPPVALKPPRSAPPEAPGVSAETSPKGEFKNGE